MKHIRPSYLALTILAGTLIAEPASACSPGMPCGGSMPSAPSPVRPSSPGVIPNIQGAVNATNSAVRGAVEEIDVKAKIRAKNPKATEEQVDAGAKKVITKRREKEAKEVEDRLALVESTMRQNILERGLELMRTEKEANYHRPEKWIYPFSSFPLPMRESDHFMGLGLGPGWIWAK